MKKLIGVIIIAISVIGFIVMYNGNNEIQVTANAIVTMIALVETIDIFFKKPEDIIIEKLNYIINLLEEQEK